MNLNVHVQREWHPMVLSVLVVTMIFLIPRSFAEVGLSMEQLDPNLHHLEGAIMPKIFGIVRGLVGIGIGMSISYVFALDGGKNVLSPSNGTSITIIVAIVFYFLPYAAALLD